MQQQQQMGARTMTVTAPTVKSPQSPYADPPRGSKSEFEVLIDYSHSLLQLKHYFKSVELYEKYAPSRFISITIYPQIGVSKEAQVP